MKTILITGGGRGIGRSTALLCGRRGWRVGINYLRDRASADEAVGAVRDAGGEAMAVQGDTATEADVIGMFNRVEERFGKLNGVVANAGIVAPSLPLAEMDLARLKRMFEVNILGTYLTAREAARRLPAAGSASLVVVSSISSRLGSPFDFVDYAGSKGAADTLVIGLAKELGPKGVRVNAVRPGLIETDIHASGGQPDRAARLGTTTPLGRAGRAEEVAEAIVWLLDDTSSYTTGALLDIGGGR